MDPEKSWNLIFPTKYVIQKSLKFKELKKHAVVNNMCLSQHYGDRNLVLPIGK